MNSFENIPAFNSIFPITICKDRYGGTYSGGEWLAIAMDVWEIVEFDLDLEDDDPYTGFWQSEDSKLIGRGNTIEDALKDMVKRHINKFGGFNGFKSLEEFENYRGEKLK